MSEFSDQYFHDLAPRQRRYDTPVSDQLHFCVFPNGVKSWVFLYEVDGHLRRRTIGLFPDMGYRDALRALDPTRRIAEVDASEQRQAVARPRISLKLTLPPAVQRFLRRISLTDVLTAAGTAVVALAALIYFGGPDEPPTAAPPPAAVARTEPAPAQPSPPETRPTATPQAATPAEETPATETPSPATRPTAGPPTEPPPAQVGAPALPEPAAPVADDPTRGTIRIAPAAPAAQAPDPVVTAFEEDPATTPADGGPAAADLEAELAAIEQLEDLSYEELEESGMTGTAAAVWADEAASQEELQAAEDEATGADAIDPDPADDPVATAGPEAGEPVPDNPFADDDAAAAPPADQDSEDLTVRRALLAGDVIDGEPRNTLSGTVTVPAGGELLIYFYIEFAEGIGQPVTHRWLNGGSVEEESAMQVDAGNGSRVYTARVIGADRAGEWRVEAVTADGRLLRGLDFTVVAAAEEAPAATLADEPPADPDS